PTGDCAAPCAATSPTATPAPRCAPTSWRASSPAATGTSRCAWRTRPWPPSAQSERVRAAGDLAAAGAQLAAWATLAALAVTGRLGLAAAGSAVVALRLANATLTAAMRTAARLFRTSLYLDDWCHFIALASRHATRRGTIAIRDQGPK